MNDAINNTLSPVEGKVAPDLEKLPFTEVLAKLGANPDRGLTGAEVQERLRQ
jgi:hypothetical protein